MMSQQTYEVRNYLPSDFDEYVKLHTEAERTDRAGYCTSRQALWENLQRPSCDPAKDFFVAEASGKIVGFLSIKAEFITRRVLLDCLVHPAHRRKGLAKNLLDQATQRARELPVEIIHVSVPEKNSPAREALSRLGFKVVRQFFEMALPLSASKLTDVSRNKFTLRHLQRGEEAELAEVQNRCFSDTWGFNPNTPEEIAHSLSVRDAAAEDVVIVYDGDRPVGYCWTIINGETSAETGGRKGRILMLGVDPDYRGRDIGRLALQAGLAYLQGKQVKAVELTVDSENYAAYSLYKSSGFQVITRSLCYEKRID